MENSNTNHSGARVGVAVVGLGLMGVTYVKALQQIPQAKLVAICDRTRKPVNGLLPGASGNTGGGDATKLDPDVAVYEKLEQVLANPQVELVCLCVPTSLHARMSLDALAAEKHVICEKPLARTARAAGEVVFAAESSTKFFMPAMCMRFWPGWSGLKKIVTEQTYGKVLAAHFRRASGPPVWGRASYFNGQESGGALLDMHIHDTDFVQFLFGRPLAVFSSGVSRFSGAVDHVLTQYRVAGGAAISAEGSWLQNTPFSMSYTVNCERATIEFDSRRGADALQVTEEGKSAETIPLEAGDGYIGELRHMVECILTKTPPSIVTAADGLSAVEICEAEEESVKTGRVISVAKPDLGEAEKLSALSR